MFFKVIREGFFILLVLYLTTILINNWSIYSPCLLPNHIYLLTAYTFILLSRAIQFFQKKNQTVFLHRIFYPVLGLIIIQGILYQILNTIYTPTCGGKLGQGQINGALLLLAIANSGPMMTALGDLLLVGLYKIFEMRIDTVIREVNTIMASQEIVLPNGFSGEAKSYRGLNNEEIAKIQNKLALKGIEQDKFMQEMCSVCYEEFKKGDDMCALPICNHIFHMHCVKEWLVKNPVCPMCRGNVRLNLEVEECEVAKAIIQV